MLRRSNSKCAAALGLTLFGLAPLSAMIHDPVTRESAQEQVTCDIDLTITGKMSDIVSNAIQVGLNLDVEEEDLKAFLKDARAKYSTGRELLEASATKFGLTNEVLTAEVEKYRHCNCSHAPLVEGQITARSSGDSGGLNDEPTGLIGCDIDLTNPGKMNDIVSNALYRGLNVKERDTRAFLDGSENRYSTGQELLEAAALEFSLSQEALTAEVEKYRHVNCSHAPLVEGQLTAFRNADASDEVPVNLGSPEVTQFAKDVTLHVVLHELAHALVREFDLPVLANEETLADAFATYYLTTYLPDRAFDVIRARTQSLMIEAGEIPRSEWSVDGEHNSDARRAFQIAAVAVAADPQKYGPIATEIGMSSDRIRGAADYGTEIHRSWRRLLRDYRMPEGKRSSESRVRLDDNSEFIDNLCSDGLADEFLNAVGSYDWHSTVTIHVTNGDGGAFWSRSKRTITVNREYVQRFVAQGKTLKR